jgi:sulfate adenylyltransferase subunit 2
MLYAVSHLQNLESEAIFVIREAAAEFESCSLLFSGGKDSAVMAHLAHKAFFPSAIPFPFIHIDTGHNFPEVLSFRDRLIQKLGVKLIVGSVEETIREGKASDQSTNGSRNQIQSITLLDTIEKHRFNACLGGARRDEEKARAKERFFSHRNEFGEWNPKNQRPELWHLFNARKKQGEHFRVFPLSNWTELDVWQYILQENLELPSVYFSHTRNCVKKNGVILAHSPYLALNNGDKVESLTVRFRTVGDMTCTGATLSKASTVEEIILETASSRVGERGGRGDDQFSETAMEDRKKAGYF